jgi:hypothetical protein
VQVAGRLDSGKDACFHDGIERSSPLS